MTLTVVSNPVHGGSITAEPPLTNETINTGSYLPTDNVTVTAAAKPGYRFINWTGDVTQIEDPTRSTIVVAMDKYFADNDKYIEITANFAKQPHFPWAWLAGGIVALFVAALALILVVRTRKKHQADTEAP